MTVSLGLRHSKRLHFQHETGQNAVTTVAIYEWKERNYKLGTPSVHGNELLNGWHRR